ncbi:hypothetical protein ACEPAH_1729 [Sanghuangporus vaninii]
MVLHLHPISEGSSLFNDRYCAASEKFAVIASGRELAIVDSDERRIVKLRFSMLDYCLGRVQIWNDHLFFFMSSNQDRKVNMYALILVQAMVAPCDPLTVTEVDPSLISSFDPMEYANDELARTSDLANAAFSLYDHSYSNEVNYVSVSIMGQMWNYSLLLNYPDIPVDNNASKPWVARETGLPRSARRLMGGRNCIVAVDSQGNFIFPRISENIASMSPEKHGGDLLHDYIELYSGTLIRLKDRQSEKAVIELYSPV